VITEESDPDILRGAAIGAAAAAVLSEIFGSIDVIEVLGGAGLGALAEILLSGSEEVEVVVIEPATDLDLTLQSEFDRDAVGSR
jgi:DNA-binding transcriptional regulator LsrR (DeoR family)